MKSRIIIYIMCLYVPSPHPPPMNELKIQLFHKIVLFGLCLIYCSKLH